MIRLSCGLCSKVPTSFVPSDICVFSDALGMPMRQLNQTPCLNNQPLEPRLVVQSTEDPARWETMRHASDTKINLAAYAPG